MEFALIVCETDLLAKQGKIPANYILRVLYICGTNLHRSLQQHVQYMGPLLHLPDIKRIGVTTLTILDGVHKTISELFLCSQQVGLHKVHHSVVYNIMQRE